MKQSGIYKIKNIETGDFYIGSSTRLLARRDEHFANAAAGRHHSIIFQRAWNKYGPEKFDFEILEECEVGDLLAREQHYLDLERPKYNISKVAGAPSPPQNKPIIRTCMETGKEKVYRTRDEAAAEGFNEGQVTSCCLGRSGSHAGYFWSFQDSSAPEFVSQRRIRPVKRIDVINKEEVYYSSMSEAANDGFLLSSISACCWGKLKTHDGYVWVFDEDDPVDVTIQSKIRDRAICRTDVNSGETKIYRYLRLVAEDGFSTGNVYACCNGHRGTHKGYRWQYCDQKNPFVQKRKKSVIGTNVETGEIREYESAAAAERDGFRAQKVGACCLGRRKTHLGYTWKFASQE